VLQNILPVVRTLVIKVSNNFFPINQQMWAVVVAMQVCLHCRTPSSL